MILWVFPDNDNRITAGYHEEYKLGSLQKLMIQSQLERAEQRNLQIALMKIWQMKEDIGTARRQNRMFE